LLVLSVILSSLLPISTAYASEISTPGSNATSNAVLTSDGLIIDVTVPSSVLIHVDEQGEVTTPDYLPIINNSIAPVYVDSLAVTTENGWTLDPINNDYTDFKVNQKNYWLSFNGLDPSSKPIALATPISGSDSLNLVLSAGVAPQRTAINALNIGEIVIVLGWDANPDAEEGTGGDQGGGNSDQGLGEMPDYYVLAEDSDWAGEADGEFTYIGSNSYVAVPHEIKGVSVTSYESMFRDTAVTGVYSDNPNITTTKAMLRGTSVEEVLLDTSNVTDMSQMFGQVVADKLDLTKLDTSKVTNYQHMFWGAKVPMLDLSTFDTSSAENVTYMFMQTETNELDLSSFQLPETADTDFMFGSTPVTTGYAKTQEDADRLNSTSGKPEHLTFVVKGGGDEEEEEIPDYDNPNFDLEDYPDGYEMSKNSDWIIFAGNLTYLGKDDNLIIPDTVKGEEVTSLQGTFKHEDYSHPVKGVYVDNPNVETANQMFQDNPSTTLDLQHINLPNLRNAQAMFNNTKAETLNLTGWNISNLHSAERMFKDSAATNIVLSGLNFETLNQAEEMFAGSNADTIKIKSITTDVFGDPKVVFKASPRMFENAAATTIDLSEFPLHIWRTGDVHSFDDLYVDMFKGVSPSATVYAYDRDNVAMIKEMTGTPAGLNPVIKGQPALPEGYVLAVDSDFSGTSDGEFSFAYKYNGNVGQYKLHDKFILPSTINGVTLTSYASMMSGWYYEGDAEKLPTHFKSSNSNIVDMSYMYQGYPTATLNLDFNTANVTTMEWMFAGAEATTLDLSGFNTDKVETMSSMFNGAEATTIDISSFKLADTQPDVDWMFKDAQATTVYVRSQADIDYLEANAGDIPETLNFVIK
ncbi:MAG: BspA family leucine-rich repeat surface protein, partial [Peptococcales bacterium]|jgi:surface protein